MPLLWRSSRESRSERCKRAFLLAPICKVLLAPTLVSDRASLPVPRERLAAWSDTSGLGKCGDVRAFSAGEY